MAVCSCALILKPGVRARVWATDSLLITTTTLVSSFPRTDNGSACGEAICTCGGTWVRLNPALCAHAALEAPAAVRPQRAAMREAAHREWDDPTEISHRRLRMTPSPQIL